jgi:SAM-dependent methyltransferase
MARRQWSQRFFDADYVALLRDTSPPSKTRREVDFVVRALRLPQGARILDVPCGYGRHSAALARRGFRVVGIDLSRAMIAEARRRWTERPRLRDHRDPGHDARLPQRLWYPAGPHRYVLEDRRFDRRANVTRSDWLIVPAGAARSHTKTTQFQEYSLPQWRRMFREVGLPFVKAYSGYDGRTYGKISRRRLIVVGARRP